jgi:hypothetical protein
MFALTRVMGSTVKGSSASSSERFLMFAGRRSFSACCSHLTTDPAALLPSATLQVPSTYKQQSLDQSSILEYSSPSTSSILMQYSMISTATNNVTKSLFVWIHDFLSSGDESTINSQHGSGLWFISTLKRRRKMMNKHKLRKRRKKNRMKTKK